MSYTSSSLKKALKSKKDNDEILIYIDTSLECTEPVVNKLIHDYKSLIIEENNYSDDGFFGKISVKDARKLVTDDRVEFATGVIEVKLYPEEKRQKKNKGK